MLLREYDENCVMNRKINCDDNIIVKYWFERQFYCGTICVHFFNIIFMISYLKIGKIYECI